MILEDKGYDELKYPLNLREVMNNGISSGGRLTDMNNS
jgi:hypothetical protein